MDKVENQKKQNSSRPADRDIFERLKAGERIRMDDPQYPRIFEMVSKTIELSVALNTSTDIDQIRDRLSEIIGCRIDNSTTVFTPFHTNFGKFITLGKNVFINNACTFLDMGGITIADDVLIGPKITRCDPRNEKCWW